VNIISPDRLTPEMYETAEVGLIELNSTGNATTSSISINQTAITWGTKSNSRPSDSFPRKGLRPWKWALIGIGIALFVLLLAVVVLILFRKRFHVILIPKDMNDNDEWGAE
jgi:hypothetical protein